MTAVLLSPPMRDLYCPNCDHRATVAAVDPAKVRPGESITEMHECRGLAGMLAPMIDVGVRCKVEAVEREDYTLGDDVRLDGEGRAIMAVVTTRDDGQDCAVMAPTVHVDFSKGVNG